MLTTDRVLRAQARALLKVLERYPFRPSDNSPLQRFWSAIELYGAGSRTARDLCTLRWDFQDPAFVSGWGRDSNRKVDEALMLGLFAFCSRSPVYRFVGPARQIALAVAKQKSGLKADSALVRRIFEELEDAFNDEVFQGVDT
jgi:hypothetical protein